MVVAGVLPQEVTSGAASGPLRNMGAPDYGGKVDLPIRLCEGGLTRPRVRHGGFYRFAGRPGGEVTATTPHTGYGSEVWASLGVLDAETEVIRCIINRLR